MNSKQTHYLKYRRQRPVTAGRLLATLSPNATTALTYHKIIDSDLMTFIKTNRSTVKTSQVVKAAVTFQKTVKTVWIMEFVFTNDHTESTYSVLTTLPLIWSLIFAYILPCLHKNKLG